MADVAKPEQTTETTNASVDAKEVPEKVVENNATPVESDKGDTKETPKQRRNLKLPL